MKGTVRAAVALLLFAAPSRSRSDGPGDLEWDIDRQGSDYAEFVLEAADPTVCQERCQLDDRCRAWTYVKENTVKGPKPRCYLKSDVPTPKPMPGRVSGVKRGKGAHER